MPLKKELISKKMMIKSENEERYLSSLILIIIIYKNYLFGIKKLIYS